MNRCPKCGRQLVLVSTTGRESLQCYCGFKEGLGVKGAG